MFSSHSPAPFLLGSHPPVPSCYGSTTYHLILSSHSPAPSRLVLTHLSLPVDADDSVAAVVGRRHENCISTEIQK